MKEGGAARAEVLEDAGPTPQLMRRLPERSQRALAEWCEWQRWWQRWSHSHNDAALKRADKALEKLLKICVPELTEALMEGGIQEITQENGITLWYFVAWPGISDAADTLRDEPGRDILQHAKACFSKALAEFKADIKRAVRKAPPEQVLDAALKLSRQRAARMLDLLSNEQQREVVRTVIERLIAAPRIERVLCRLEDEYEPEDALLWIVWYIGRQHAAALFEERTPTRGENRSRPTIMVFGVWDEHGQSRKLPKSKGNVPSNLAGPMNTRLWLAIASEMTRHGLRISDPGSLGRIARLSGFSRDIVRRWHAHPQFLSLGEITPDGRGGVYCKLTLEDFVRSIEIFEPGKPGPKPHLPVE